MAAGTVRFSVCDSSGVEERTCPEQALCNPAATERSHGKDGDMGRPRRPRSGPVRRSHLGYDCGDIQGRGIVGDMRIVSWNCRKGGVHDEHLAELAPDIAILPEWGRLPILGPATASSFAEFGETGKFGLGVAAFGDWMVAKADVPAISGGVIGAVKVAGPKPFALVAVWSYLSGRPKVNPVIEALEAWADWLAGGAVVVAGDFNTGGGWKHIF